MKEPDNIFAQYLRGIIRLPAMPLKRQLRDTQLFNAGFGGDVMNKEQTLFSIYFSANNITDRAYQPHLSRLKYASENTVSGRRGVYNTGRNISVKINIPLSFPVKK